MDRIKKAIRCIECENVLNTPIILPCNHSICKKHLNKRNIGKKLICAKCGIDHEIPANGFPLNEALCEIIDAQISSIDFGSIHKEAAESLDRLTREKKCVENLLSDPYSYVDYEIGQLKNQVHLKREQLKLKIDEEADKLLGKLDDYQTRCENLFGTEYYLIWKNELESNIYKFSFSLSCCKSKLNELKFDESKWRKITEESNKAIEAIVEGRKTMKNDMLLGKFKKYSNYVGLFEQISIDDLFTPRNRSPSTSNRNDNQR